MFSSFLLILMHVLHHARRSLKEAFDFPSKWVMKMNYPGDLSDAELLQLPTYTSSTERKWTLLTNINFCNCDEGGQRPPKIQLRKIIDRIKKKFMTKSTQSLQLYQNPATKWSFGKMTDSRSEVEWRNKERFVTIHTLLSVNQECDLGFIRVPRGELAREYIACRECFYDQVMSLP